MHQNSNHFDCDILVVGAGPTGLSLAAALATRGVQVRIIDRQAQGTNTSRAAVVHARTLEALEQISVTDRLKARGIKCGTFSVRDRDRTLLSIDFKDLPTPYPYTLMISQAVTEGVLEERLCELGVAVHRPQSLSSFTQDEEGVDAILDDGSRIRARYLVGADGMHSRVRQLAGIAFEGDRYAQSFILADVRLTGSVPQDEVVLYFSPAGLVVAAPLPDGFHRIVATVDHAPEFPSIDDIQGLLNNRGPARDRANVESMVWSSRFRVHHRLADNYRSGRVVLAGDAAHVHSPAGGQGMNTGIQDAMSLANSLAMALLIGNPAVLDRYTTQRRPVAQGVIALADRLTRVATVRRFLCPLRNFLVSLIGRSPTFRRKLAFQLAGVPPTREHHAILHPHPIA